MIKLTDERGRFIYVAREAIAVIRPVVVKETAPVGKTAVMLGSGQTLFVEDSIEDVLAQWEKKA